MMLHPVGCVSVSREVVIDVYMALDQTLTERNPWRSQTGLVKTRAGAERTTGLTVWFRVGKARSFVLALA
ncbi:hypothetical protein L204_102453 [Cryptococcus depauperatus]